MMKPLRQEFSTILLIEGDDGIVLFIEDLTQYQVAKEEMHEVDSSKFVNATSLSYTRDQVHEDDVVDDNDDMVDDNEDVANDNDDMVDDNEDVANDNDDMSDDNNIVFDDEDLEQEWQL
ncbi:hypothetical protein P8452_36357 [Trifolium repens]|nr:hypothetical protein P8452_36357 [Trifolium repens]